MADGITERHNEKNVQAREETRAGERYIRPAVDIIETEEGLTPALKAQGYRLLCVGRARGPVRLDA